MASESTMKGVNGYASQQPYEQQMPTHGSSNATSGSFNAESSNTPSAGNNASSAASEGNGSVPKDEVGWYFVEQYYTTLSKNPEKLHLFYSKRSQFVSGVEAEKVSVSVGQRAINDRIKELDISDCKVRVSNVDSQESFKNIVVQVIGEMSNKAAPHRKFVQTFVLAEQPNGYFVLNDIFRYIVEEEEEEQLEPEGPAIHEPPPTAAPEAEPETLTSSTDPEQQQHDVEQVDRKLQEELEEKGEDTEVAAVIDEATNTVSPESTGIDKAVDDPAAAGKLEEDVPQPEEISVEAAETATASEDLQPEKQEDAEPTPVASPLKPAPAAPAQAPVPAAQPKPAAPKTWANLVAANRVAPPAVSSPAASTSPAASQPKAPQSQPQRSTSPSASLKEEAPPRSQTNGNSGWQMAGQDGAKRQNRQQSMSGNTDKDNVLGYVKNVTEKVDASLLKAALLEHGKLVYFDVSRQKNCAFVEFSDAAGYQSAVAANPYNIGGEQIWVEERRPRPTAYGGGYNARGGMRGGRGGSEGRGGSQGRGGFPKDGRGGFAPRGRGGNMTPRGRGQPQPA